MPNQFLSPEGDLENYFISDYSIIDQYSVGELWTWGNRSSGGGFGDNDISTSTPIDLVFPLVETNSKWRTAVSSVSNTAAIKSDGTLWIWGDGSYGGLGNNLTTRAATPITTFVGGTDWKTISLANSVAALKSDGTLWTWGANGPQLGRFNTGTVIVTPVTIFGGGTNWADASSINSYDLYTLSASYYSTATEWRGSAAAIKTDGTLWMWGNYNYVPPLFGSTLYTTTPVTIFGGGTNWKSISIGYNSLGYSHTGAIKTDGTLWNWGGNQFTPTTTFAGGTNWRQISMGNNCSIALKTDGTLWIWGSNVNGVLGNGITTGTISTPVTTFAGGTNWNFVSSSQYYYTQTSAGIKTDGTLWIWGNGTYGTLGDATLNARSTPITTFAGGTNWKQMSNGWAHVAAIKTDGTLWTWGLPNGGTLGNGNVLTLTSTPVTTFAGGTNWKQVVTANGATAAVKTDGTLWLWGDNTMLGSANTNPNYGTSTPITTSLGGTNWKQVYAGGGMMLALNDDGVNKRLFVWGNNKWYNTGTLYTPPEYIPAPMEVGATGWKRVSMYGQTAVGLKNDGTLWTWGFGTYGRLGINDTIDRPTPVTTFVGGNNWIDITASFGGAGGVKSDGTLWVWGNNMQGRLGVGDLIDRWTPVTISIGGTNWKILRQDDRLSLAAKTDGTVWSWGLTSNWSFYGTLGSFDPVLLSSASTPTTTFAGGTNWAGSTIVDPTDVSHFYTSYNYPSAAIKTDGTLWVWNSVLSGLLNGPTFSPTPTTTFAGGTNWKTISGGSAVKTDGTLWTWGAHSLGTTGAGQVSGSTSTPITTFAGGTDWKISYETFAIKTDGTLWIWGYGTGSRAGNGQTASNSISTPVTTFAGGTNWKQVAYQLGIKTDGTLWVWGNTDRGRLGNGLATFGTISTPVTTFAGGTNWKQATCIIGDMAVAAIKTDGTLWLWGRNPANNLLGFVGYNSHVSTPITIFGGGTNWKQVSGGNTHFAAVKTDGTLWLWGSGASGALGVGDTLDRSTPVTSLIGGTNWAYVNAGNSFTSAIKTDGTLWICGSNAQTGVGNNFNPYNMYKLSTLPIRNWKDLSVKNTQTCFALDETGQVWMWGMDDGRIPLGSGYPYIATAFTPLPAIGFGNNWKTISGYYHYVGIKNSINAEYPLI